MIFKSSKRSRRQKNQHKTEDNTTPFFSKSSKTSVQKKEDDNFFQRKSDSKSNGLKIGQPNDKYEKEADAMADSVVNKSNGGGAVQKKAEGIQKATLATPQEDEKLGTAEQRLEEDKLIQEKPIQRMEGEDLSDEALAKSEEEPVQMQSEEEEEPIQKMEGKEEEEEPVQMKEEEEEPIQTKTSSNNPSRATNNLSQKIKSKKGKGQTIQNQTKSEMENSFGVDFSNVNIHTDNEAVQMNKELGAQAFTHGRDVYFNKGKYRPETSDGKRLLAHELTHVVQQNTKSNLKIQRVTCSNQSGRQPDRRPQGAANPLDDRSNRIIAMASASGQSNQQKATSIITAIICYYYNPLQNTVRNITHDADLSSGLMATRVGRGNTAKGDITVSNQFIEGTTRRHFARRVLQVGHELRHIQQYRSGLIGRGNQNEREFLAHSENALADEFVGTGRMSRATRRNIIDAALGYYFCLSTAKQQEYANRRRRLISRRAAINDSAGRGPTAAPNVCTRP